MVIAVDQPPRFWAIVPAAGKGRRMQQAQPKQYNVLHGRCIIEHSIEALLNSELLERVVVCTAPNDKTWASLKIARHVLVEQITGGETRAQSVLNGLNSLATHATDNDWVLVHDAARPCLKTQTLKKMIRELSRDPVGGILASRSSDTLKRANSETPPSIVKTLDRDDVWRAQTPQLFRFGLLKRSLSKALDEGFDVTDEASAMEREGYSVRLFEGDANNIKVTTRDDLVLAEFLLKQV